MTTSALVFDHQNNLVYFIIRGKFTFLDEESKKYFDRQADLTIVLFELLMRLSVIQIFREVSLFN